MLWEYYGRINAFRIFIRVERNTTLTIPPNSWSFFCSQKKLTKYLKFPTFSFFDSLDRIYNESYHPTHEDIIMAYIPTVGVQNVIFTISHYCFQLDGGVLLPELINLFAESSTSAARRSSIENGQLFTRDSTQSFSCFAFPLMIKSWVTKKTRTRYAQNLCK